MAEQSRRFVSLDKPIDKFIEDQKKHSFKDTQRCKFADWVSQLQKWKQKNEEFLPKELNEYISEFIVAARRKNGEDFEASSLRGLICCFNRHLKACKYPCSVIQTHQARVWIVRQRQPYAVTKLNFIGLPILGLLLSLFPYLIKNWNACYPLHQVRFLIGDIFTCRVW